MGKAGRFIAGAILILAAIPLAATGNWNLAFAAASTGFALITRPNVSKDLASQQGTLLQNRFGTQQGLPVIYGRARVGAILADVRTDTSSAKNKRLCVVAAWCHGSQDGSNIDGIDFIYFGQRTAVATGSPTNPFNTTVPEGGTQFLVITDHLGSTAQTVDSLLNSRFATAWPTTSKGAGIAYTRLDLWFDQDIYGGGLPQIAAVIRGAKVLDPRDSVVKYSDNPALCIRDYLTSPIYGLGVPTTNIDAQSFIDAANYCDEIVTIPTEGSVARYTLNGVVNTSNSVLDNLVKLCTSCRAQIINQGNKWRIVIRNQRAASGLKINKDNTLEGSWRFILPGAEVPNFIRANFVNKNGGGANTYQVDTVEWPGPADTNPYIDSDNGFESRLDIDLPYTVTYGRAQQLAMTMLKEARVGVTAVCTLREEAIQMQVGDVVEVTHESPGWTDKKFDVIAFLAQPDGAVQVVLAEYNDLSYSLDPLSSPPSTPGSGLPDPFSASAPSSLQLFAGDTEALVNPDGTKVARIKMTWSPPTDPFLKFYEIQAKKTADSIWDSFGTAPNTDTQFFVVPVTEVSWDVRIRAVTQMEVRSTWVSSTITPNLTDVVFVAPSFNFSAPGAPAINNPLYSWHTIDSPTPPVGILDATDGTTYRDFLKADWGGDKLFLVAGATIIGTDPTGSQILRVGGSIKASQGLDVAGSNFIVDTSTAKWTFGSSGSLADADLGASGNVGNLVIQGRGSVTAIGRSNSASPGTTNTIFLVQAFTTATRQDFFLIREDGQMDFGLGTDWRITSAGHFIAPTDNTKDIGASAATRPRTLYLGTSLIVGTDPGGSTAFRLGGAALMNVATGYATIVGDSGTSYRGGLLLANSLSAVRYFKFVATFTGSPGTSSRSRLGWVADTDLETFLNSGAVLEVAPNNDLLINAGGTGVVTIGSDPGGTAKLRVGGDVRIGSSLGIFDSTNDGAGTPLDGQLLTYKASTSKWISKTIQLSFNTGVMVASNLGDGSAWTGANSNPSLSGTPTAPTNAPVVTAGYQCFIVDMSLYVLGGTQVYVLDYAVNGGSYTTNAIICTSSKIVWTDIPSTTGFSSSTTFTWKYKIRGATDSAYSPASSSASYSTVTNVFPFSLIVASQIATVNLAAIIADLGIIIAGRIQNSSNSAGVRVSTGYSLPTSWDTYLDLPTQLFSVWGQKTSDPGFEAGTGDSFAVGSATRVQDATQFHSGTKSLKVTTANATNSGVQFSISSSVGYDIQKSQSYIWSVWVLASAGGNGKTLKFRIIQKDANGVTVATTDSSSFTITQTFTYQSMSFTSHASAVTAFTHVLTDSTEGIFDFFLDDVRFVNPRVQVGKVGAGNGDYGLQVFDVVGATVMDFTGNKRIMAVPVQPSVDSGSSVTVDLSTGLTQQVRLTTSAAAITLSNPTNGARYRMWFQQDTTGSRTWPTIKGPTGDEIVMFTNDTVPTLTTTPGVFDLFEFEYRTSPTNRFTCMTLQTNVFLPVPIIDNVRGTGFSTASTTHNVVANATILAGDLLIIVIFFAATPGTITTPSGWTAKGSSGSIASFAKIADGTEDGTNVNVVTANSVKASAQMFRIHKWYGDLTYCEIANTSGAPGTSANPDPITPVGGPDRFLFIAVVGVTANPTITDPANYAGTTTQTDDGSVACRLRSVTRQQASKEGIYCTTEDPAAFTWTGSQTWSVTTISVRPPA